MTRPTGFLCFGDPTRPADGPDPWSTLGWYAYLILWRSECLWLFQNRRQQKQFTQDVVLQKQVNKLESSHIRSHRPINSASFFSCNYKVWLMILTSAKMNQQGTHLGYKSSTSTVTMWTYRQTHTHQTCCSSWTGNTPTDRQCSSP